MPATNWEVLVMAGFASRLKFSGCIRQCFLFVCFILFDWFVSVYLCVCVSVCLFWFTDM